MRHDDVNWAAVLIFAAGMLIVSGNGMLLIRLPLWLLLNGPFGFINSTGCASV
jgi:hypothetical protein